jgi:hypothetical protein
MQPHHPTATTLPMPPIGRSRGVVPFRQQWPDVLTTRVLYRGTHLRADSPRTAHNARALVTAVLADWRILPVLDDAVMCVSELVGNAVEHADQPVIGGVDDRLISVGVRCWAGSALFLEIGDYDPRMPTLAENPDSTAVDGRGLFIVDKLADRLWWQRAAHGGKVVYARFHLPRYGLSRSMVGL